MKAPEHRGFYAEAHIDWEAGVIRGQATHRLHNPGDVITFQGTTVAEAERAFRDSVDDYLAFVAGNKR